MESRAERTIKEKWKSDNTPPSSCVYPRCEAISISWEMRMVVVHSLWMDIPPVLSTSVGCAFLLTAAQMKRKATLLFPEPSSYVMQMKYRLQTEPRKRPNSSDESKSQMAHTDYTWHCLTEGNEQCLLTCHQHRPTECVSYASTFVQMIKSKKFESYCDS